MIVTYCDASALVKLFVPEAQSADLRAYLAGAHLVTSVVARTEIVRACVIGGATDRKDLRQRFGPIDFVPLTAVLADWAGDLAGVHLRSLDAIHLASALSVRADVLVAYDVRLLQAAQRAGMAVASPGADLV